jgi:hypothetical protein
MHLSTPVSRDTSGLAVVFAANYIAALIYTVSCIQSSRNVSPPTGQLTHYRSQFRRFRLYEAEERARQLDRRFGANRWQVEDLSPESMKPFSRREHLPKSTLR